MVGVLQVETFCVHGSPTGYITGIRGRVQCVTDRELAKLKLSEFERKQMVQQKCYLRFPNLPFIPRQPYNVLDTDYDNYALVSGAKDASFIQVPFISFCIVCLAYKHVHHLIKPISFQIISRNSVRLSVLLCAGIRAEKCITNGHILCLIVHLRVCWNSLCQIYSRTPNPGREFIENKKAVLATLGYDAEDIRDTPQDCEETPVEELEGMMAKPDVENVLDNQFQTQPLGLNKGVQLNPFTSNLETIKKLIQLYLPKFN